MANDLIANAPEVPLAEGTRSGIVALAHLYKAKCLGFVAQAFAHAPLDVQADGQAQFRPREELFAAAISSLDRALETATSTPPSDEFNADILGEGFDLLNTIRAYRARYHLFSGNYQAALDDAEAVDPIATSVYTYDAENENPLYAQVVVADDYAPRDHFGLSSTESGDARLAFYTAPSERTSNPNDFPIEDLTGFWHSATSPIPAYLPGEMALTRAEAHARLGNIDAAIAEIDAVRTKTPADDPYGVGSVAAAVQRLAVGCGRVRRNFSSAPGGTFSPWHWLGRQPALGTTWPFGRPMLRTQSRFLSLRRPRAPQQPQYPNRPHRMTRLFALTALFG